MIFGHPIMDKAVQRSIARRGTLALLLASVFVAQADTLYLHTGEKVIGVIDVQSYQQFVYDEAVRKDEAA
jgi:hypothetical protein